MATDTQTSEAWPPLGEWEDTRAAVHLVTQMVGKVKLALSPFVNQWWQVGLELDVRGLTSGLIPLTGRSAEISLDLVDHRLLIVVSDGSERVLPLGPGSIADFLGAFEQALRELGIDVAINPHPAEIPGAIPLDQDTAPRPYDRDAVTRWWRAMLSVERVLERFRPGYEGKSSPILFYWGGCDLNHTRFNGRRVALPADADRLRRFGENEENIAVGFWPGNADAPPVLYGYGSPAPPDVASVPVAPPAAWLEAMGEFVLPYDALRSGDDPDAAALAFFQSVYAGSAERAGWDRAQLEGPVPTRPTTRSR